MPKNEEPEALLPSDEATYYDSFQKNILNFVTTSGKEVKLPIESLRCWFVSLSDGTHLHIYAETIGKENCSCDQCRIIGWGIHPVSTVRYHFIIPAETGPESLQDPRSLPSIAEASFATSHTHRPNKSSSSSTTPPLSSFSLPARVVASPDAHISPYNAPTTIFDSTRHRLHGVLHANGYGHLLRVNGVEGGAKSHTGKQMVVLWDTLCEGLRARSITVEDVSNKAGMDLRILHKIAWNCTWYGHFGYHFGRGAYNISQYTWDAAAAYLQHALLSKLLEDFDAVESGIPRIIDRYQLPIGRWDKVTTLGLLLLRLLYLQSHLDDALEFFDPGMIADATERMKKKDEEELQKRLAIRHKQGGSKGKGKGSLSSTAVDVAAAKSGGKSGGGGKDDSNKAMTTTVSNTTTKHATATKFKLRINDPTTTTTMNNNTTHTKNNDILKRKRVDIDSFDVDTLIGRGIKVYLRDKRTWYKGSVTNIVDDNNSSGDDTSDGIMVEVKFRDFSHVVDLSQDQHQFTDGLPSPPTLLRSELPKIKKEMHDDDKVVVKNSIGKSSTMTKQNNNTKHGVEKKGDDTTRAQHKKTTTSNTTTTTANKQHDTNNTKSSNNANKPSTTNTTNTNTTNAVHVNLSTADVLYYKAALARNDTVERARQLSRALKTLFPQSKDIIGSAKLKGELESAFSKVMGKKAPQLTSEELWYESLPIILDWAQSTIYPNTKQKKEASSCIIITKGHVEIHKHALHEMGLYPDSWTMPITAASIVKANKSGAVEWQKKKEKEKKELEKSDEQKNNKSSSVVVKKKARFATDNDTTTTTTTTAKSKDTQQQQQQQQQQPTTTTTKKAHSSTQQQPATPAVTALPPTSPAMAINKQRPPVVNTTTNTMSPLISSSPTTTTTTMTMTTNSKQQQQRVRYQPRSPLPPNNGADMHPADYFQLSKPSSSLPSLNIDHILPNTTTTTNNTTNNNTNNNYYPVPVYQQAIDTVLAIIRAHPKRWVSPHRLIGLSFAAGCKDTDMALAALHALADHVYQGCAIHRVVDNQGQEYYLGETVSVVDSGRMVGNNANNTTGSNVRLSRSIKTEADGDSSGQRTTRHATNATTTTNNVKDKDAKVVVGKKKTTTTATASTAQQTKPIINNKKNNNSKTTTTTAIIPAPQRQPLVRPPEQQAAVDAAVAAALAPPPPPPPPQQLLQQQHASFPLSNETRKPWMDLIPGADLKGSHTKEKARLQITRDLHHVYTAVLKNYLPLIAKTAAEHAALSLGQRAAVRVLKLKQLPEEVQVLRDTKHFVKVCTRETAPLQSSSSTLSVVGDHDTGSKKKGGDHHHHKKKDYHSHHHVDDMILIWCKIAVPKELSTPPLISTTRFGRKFVPVDPPPEPIVISKNATLGQFMSAVTDSYRSMYRMCEKFTASVVISGLVGGSGSSSGDGYGGRHHSKGTTTTTTSAATKGDHQSPLYDPSTPILSLLPPPPTTQQLQQLQQLSDTGIEHQHHHRYHPFVVVAGTGLNITDECWLHAGGPEDWIVNCSCGTRDDDGEAMVSCDVCAVWMHTRCVGVPDDASSWVCEVCLKRSMRIE